MYHEQRHSKGDADKDFGSLTTALRRRSVFSVDCVAGLARELPRKARPNERNVSRIFNPEAGTHWTGHTSKRFNPVLELSQATGNRHILISMAEGALDRLSTETITFMRRGERVETSIRAEVLKLIGERDGQPAMDHSEMRLFDYPPADAVIGVRASTIEKADSDSDSDSESGSDAGGDSNEAERQPRGRARGRGGARQRGLPRVELPPQAALESTHVDVLVNKTEKAASFVEPSSRREHKLAMARTAAEKGAAKVAAAAAAAPAAAPPPAVVAAAKKMKGGVWVNPGQAAKLGPNCVLQQEHFKADMSQSMKARLHLPDMAVHDDTGKASMNPKYLGLCRRLNVVTRPPDETAEHPHRLFMAALTEKAPGSFTPQVDRGGSNKSFYLGPGESGGFYNKNAESAIPRFEAANSDKNELAVFRDLYSAACVQNGAPLHLNSFVVPSLAAIERDKKRKKEAKEQKPQAKRTRVTAFQCWKKSAVGSTARGAWQALPAEASELWTTAAEREDESRVAAKELEAAELWDVAVHASAVLQSVDFIGQRMPTSPAFAEVSNLLTAAVTAAEQAARDAGLQRPP